MNNKENLYVRLLSYVRPYWKAFVGALLAMSATAAMEPLFPALMKPLLDGDFSGKGVVGGQFIVPVAIVGIFLGRGLLGFVADYAMSWVANKVILDLRNAMFTKLVALPTNYFDNQSSGALMSKVAYDVTGVTGAATSVLTVMVRDTLTIIGLLGWMLYLNWKLTLVAITMIPLVGLSVKLFSGRLRQMSRGGQLAMGEIMHVLEETTSAHKVIKIFGGQGYEIDRFNRANALQRGYNMRATVAAAMLGPLVQVFASIALAIIISVALHQTTHAETSVGAFVSFVTTMLMLLAPMKRLTDVNAPLQKGMAAAESVFQLVDEAPETDDNVAILANVSGEVEYQDVTLVYDGKTTPALDGVSFHVRPGETVAFVGASGGGKSSLANLLPRFYEPSKGKILVDGIDISTVTLPSLRKNISLVSQDVVLFNDSVLANIAYGIKNPSLDEVIRSAKSANAYDFIMQMPEGFNTLIGENGVKLSGGQRQRIAIARAILKNSPILILDEATSALDTVSESLVQEALEKLMQGRTTIVIAHRLSTIEKSNRIFVLSKGRVVESGSHDELISLRGIYFDLYNIQRVERLEATE